MLNQILRFTLVSGLLLWLKPRWRGLLALVVFVVMVHVIHGEYLGYVELSGNQSFLLWSYALKWFALLVGVLAYVYFAFDGKGRLLSRESGGDGSRTDRSNRGVDQKSAKFPGKTGASAEDSAETDDGFDFLRKKKALDNPADKILQYEKKLKG